MPGFKVLNKCMGVWLVCMCAICKYLQRTERGELQTVVSYRGYWELSPGLLEDQPVSIVVLLTGAISPTPTLLFSRQRPGVLPSLA